jgi:hypothetical protein
VIQIDWRSYECKRDGCSWRVLFAPSIEAAHADVAQHLLQVHGIELEGSMASRRERNPVEIASDLGARAHDLYSCGNARALAALSIVAQVNPEMLAWLRDRLLDITEQRPLPESATKRDAVDPHATK